jgi:hypothetical protein
MIGTMKMRILWDIALCSLGVYRRFIAAYCLHHQGGEKAARGSSAGDIAFGHVSWSLAMGIALMMEAVRTSETSVNFNKINGATSRREDLKSHMRIN